MGYLQLSVRDDAPGMWTSEDNAPNNNGGDEFCVEGRPHVSEEQEGLNDITCAKKYRCVICEIPQPKLRRTHQQPSQKTTYLTRF